MKKLLILPGNGPRNQVWGEECERAYGGWFDEAVMVSYNHWKSEEKAANVPEEIAKIKALVAESPEAAWYVCAKSIGTLIALQAVHQGALAPTKCVFFGMPLMMAAEEMFQNDWSAFERFSVPTLALHNNQDPVANCDYTREKIINHQSHITLKIVHGDTHDYLDFAQYEPDIQQFLTV